MAYVRVIPRDLFNEGNLLKCLGRLIIELETIEHTAYLEEPVSAAPFDVQQDPNSGSISVVNLPFTIRGRPYRLTRPLNSRQPWPLYAEDDENAVSVFADNGKFTPEFRRLIAAKG